MPRLPYIAVLPALLVAGCAAGPAAPVGSPTCQATTERAVAEVVAAMEAVEAGRTNPAQPSILTIRTDCADTLPESWSAFLVAADEQADPQSAQARSTWTAFTGFVCTGPLAAVPVSELSEGAQQVCTGAS